MKRFVKVFLLICIMASFFAISAYADSFEVNDVPFDNWEDAFNNAKSINTGDITIEFTGTVAVDKSDFLVSGYTAQLFNTDGKVSFVGSGSGSAIFQLAEEYNQYTLYQPGGLSFSGLTINDLSWCDGGDSASNQGGWGYRYFDVHGLASFDGVYFPADSGAQVDGGTVYFSGCTFESTANEYGLWVACGEAVVSGSSFNGDRAIKICNEYDQGSFVGVDASGNNFNQTNKPAIESDIYDGSGNNHEIKVGDNNFGSQKIVGVKRDTTNIALTSGTVAIDPAVLELEEAKTYQLKYMLTGGSGIEWTSSNPEVATVDANGLVTAVKAGNATISATIIGTDVSATSSITVVKPAVANPFEVPSTADNSNMPLWGALFLAFAAVALLTGKKRRA